jgi:hypothetical protein
MQQEPPCSNQLLALGTLMLGAGTAIAFVMLANGRHKEVYPLAGALALVTATYGAVKMLGAQSQG